MDSNKYILDRCPNFYKIVNFDYFEDDKFTDILIKVYRKYIFSINPLNEIELNKCIELDRILAKYIDDYNFRKAMNYELTKVKFQSKENMIQNLINSIIGIFEKYEEGRTRNIYVARWI